MNIFIEMNQITKKELIVYSVIWLIGVFLFLLANTDRFAHGLVFKGQQMIWVLLVFSTVAVASFYVKYYRSRKVGK